MKEVQGEGMVASWEAQYVVSDWETSALQRIGSYQFKGGWVFPGGCVFFTQINKSSIRFRTMSLDDIKTSRICRR